MQQGGYGPPPGPAGPPGGPYDPAYGYGQPMQPTQQGYPMAAQGYGAPPVSGAPTVLGIPLEPGERVIFYRRHDYTVEMVVFLIVGVLLLIVLIGIVFIILGATANSRNPRAHIVTNRRLIVVSGKGAIQQQLALNHIVDIEAERQRSRGGGGLVGLAVGAAISAAQNHFANQNHKLDPKYWRRTVALNLVFSNGARARVPAGLGYGADLGQLVARAVFNREAEMLPPVAYQP